jgi:hypothetical protein
VTIAMSTQRRGRDEDAHRCRVQRGHELVAVARDDGDERRRDPDRDARPDRNPAGADPRRQDGAHRERRPAAGRLEFAGNASLAGRRGLALASAPQTGGGALVDALQLAQARHARGPRPVGLGAI